MGHWREPLEDMLRERSAKLEKLNGYFRTVYIPILKSYRLEDITRIMRFTKVGICSLERFSIDFSQFNLEANYKNYKEDLVWYFHFPLEEQPGKTIDYLYDIFFGARVNLPSRSEINYRE